MTVRPSPITTVTLNGATVRPEFCQAMVPVFPETCIVGWAGPTHTPCLHPLPCPHHWPSVDARLCR